MDRTEKLLNLLNTFGHKSLLKKDVYNWLMGDETALDKYQGDPEPIKKVKEISSWDHNGSMSNQNSIWD